ncbi:MAG TPA: hypothetical protein ENN06_04265 [Desulfobacteraceae bacterium]|nr:hypothetical protein [Desulfobacteraceae bacterium]
MAKKGQIDVTISVKVMTGKREEFIQAIRSLKGDFVKKVKVGKPILYQKIDDRTVFSLVCELGNEEDLKVLEETEEFKVLMGALKVLCQESDIRYSYVYRNEPAQPWMSPEPESGETEAGQDLDLSGPEPPEWQH